MNKETQLQFECLDWLIYNVDAVNDEQVRIKGELFHRIDEALNPTKKTLPYKEALEIGFKIKRSSQRKMRNERNF